VAGKETLNTDTKELFDIANLIEVVELNKLLFKLLKLVLVVRVVKHDNIIYVEEENNLFIYPKA
jgi:hypothetical protein